MDPYNSSEQILTRVKRNGTILNTILKATENSVWYIICGNYY